jgi:hypothetical protein
LVAGRLAGVALADADGGVDEDVDGGAAASSVEAGAAETIGPAAAVALGAVPASGDAVERAWTRIAVAPTKTTPPTTSGQRAEAEPRTRATPRGSPR